MKHRLEWILSWAHGNFCEFKKLHSLWKLQNFIFTQNEWQNQIHSSMKWLFFGVHRLQPCILRISIDFNLRTSSVENLCLKTTSNNLTISNQNTLHHDVRRFNMATILSANEFPFQRIHHTYKPYASIVRTRPQVSFDIARLFWLEMRVAKIHMICFWIKFIGKIVSRIKNHIKENSFAFTIVAILKRWAPCRDEVSSDYRWSSYFKLLFNLDFRLRI